MKSFLLQLGRDRSRINRAVLFFVSFLILAVLVFPDLAQARHPVTPESGKREAQRAAPGGSGGVIFPEYDNRKVLYGYVKQEVVYLPADQIWRELDRDWSLDPAHEQLTLQTDRGPLILRVDNREAGNIQGSVYVPAGKLAEHAGVDIRPLDSNHLAVSTEDRRLLVQLKPITSAYLYEPEKIDVILYHHFTDQSDSLTVTPERFREHLDALLQHGYETITDEDLYRYKTDPDYKLPKKPLFITIDDGYASNYTIAYPLLREKGLRATIYVITSYRGRTPGIIPHFDWEQAREMQDSGVINIESHTHNLHYYEMQGEEGLPAMLYRKPGESSARYEARIYDDLQTSRTLIAEHLGKAPISLSYPYGAYDEATISLAKKAGYKLLITTETDRNERDGNLLINRINVDGRYSAEKLIRLLNP